MRNKTQRSKPIPGRQAEVWNLSVRPDHFFGKKHACLFVCHASGFFSSSWMRVWDLEGRKEEGGSFCSPSSTPNVLAVKTSFSVPIQRKILNMHVIWCDLLEDCGALVSTDFYKQCVRFSRQLGGILIRRWFIKKRRLGNIWRGDRPGPSRCPPACISIKASEKLLASSSHRRCFGRREGGEGGAFIPALPTQSAKEDWDGEGVGAEIALLSRPSYQRCPPPPPQIAN